MSDDVVVRYTSARAIEAPAALLKDAIDEVKKLRVETARLRRAVKNAYYEGWQDNASIDDTEERLHVEWECSEACAAIREGGEGDT